MTTSPSLFSLRGLLLLDAATCAAMGALLVLAAGPIAGLTAIPETLLLYAGLSLPPVAAFMAMVATRQPVPRAGVWLIILGNICWVAASLVVVGATAPNPLGIGFLLAQAAVVALLAKLERDAVRAALAIRLGADSRKVVDPS